VSEAVEVVNPVVEVVGVFDVVAEVAWLGRSPRQSIWSMLHTRDMSELKVKGMNRDYPSIDTCGRGCIWVIQHSPDVPGVYFDD
jgi:hypothetical protein